MSKAKMLKNILDTYRPLPRATAESLEASLMMRYNQESNAIEGNKLTLVETKVLLEHGITANGKSFKDHLDIINHQEAIFYLMDLVKEKASLTQRVILEFNALILKGSPEEKHGQAGRFRNTPVFISGSPHVPPQPYLVAPFMEQLITRYQENLDKAVLSPIENIARLHADFVGIHPFIDGNGRTGRLVMNMELMKAGYPVAIIESANKKHYYDALQAADKQDYQPIVQLLDDTLAKQLTDILNVIDPEWNRQPPEMMM